MRMIKMILLFVLIYLLAGCKEDKIFEHRFHFSPISIECDYLDTIFSDENHLLIEENNNKNKTYYIVNSKEELDAINPFDFGIDCIDFSECTLIWGIINTAYSIEQEYMAIIVGDGAHHIFIKLGNEVFTQSKELCFWGVFEKGENMYLNLDIAIAK